MLEAIKERTLNYEELRYKMIIILDGFMAFLNCYQEKKESLQDYTRRFKLAQEIMNSHLGGGIVLNKFVSSMDRYDRNKVEKENIAYQNSR